MLELRQQVVGFKAIPGKKLHFVTTHKTYIKSKLQYANVI